MTLIARHALANHSSAHLLRLRPPAARWHTHSEISAARLVVHWLNGRSDVCVTVLKAIDSCTDLDCKDIAELYKRLYK